MLFEVALKTKEKLLELTFEMYIVTITSLFPCFNLMSLKLIELEQLYPCGKVASVLFELLPKSTPLLMCLELYDYKVISCFMSILTEFMVRDSHCFL